MMWFKGGSSWHGVRALPQGRFTGQEVSYVWGCWCKTRHDIKNMTDYTWMGKGGARVWVPGYRGGGGSQRWGFFFLHSSFFPCPSYLFFSLPLRICKLLHVTIIFMSSVDAFIKSISIARSSSRLFHPDVGWCLITHISMASPRHPPPINRGRVMILFRFGSSANRCPSVGGVTRLAPATASPPCCATAPLASVSVVAHAQVQSYESELVMVQLPIAPGLTDKL